MKFLGFILSVLLLFGIQLTANQPIPYSGKISIRGVNYDGDAQFTYSLVDKDGKVYWRNGSKAGETIKVNVRNGFYTVLLGGQGMNILPPQLFLDNEELYLKVHFDNGDGQGLRHLEPDQRITATPRALVAEVAKVAKVAELVKDGVITRNMLHANVLSDLSQPTPASGSIKLSMLDSEVTAKLDQAEVADGSVTASKMANNSVITSHLSEQILKYLKPEITAQPKSKVVFVDSNTSFSVTAEGKYLTYQWKKDGVGLTGEANTTINITDSNSTLHDGNYSVVVSNDFGSVESNITNFTVVNEINAISGLVGWWKFDETNSSVAIDSSGYGRNGTLRGFDSNTTQWVSGKIGGALCFDGINDYLEVLDYKGISGSNPRTMSAWIKTDSNDSAIIGWGKAAVSNKWLFSVRDGKLKNEIWNGHKTSVSFVNINQWTHVSLVQPSGNILISGTSLYVSGSIQSANKFNDGAYINTALDSNLIIGGDLYGSSWLNFDGLIDDVRIYGRALSSAEVQALYNLGQ